jgi:hypothetical protein
VEGALPLVQLVLVHTRMRALYLVPLVVIGCAPSVGDGSGGGHGGGSGSGSGSGAAACDSGAYDIPGNGIDDDCNGIVDDAVASCDQGMSSNSQTAMDYAKAIDLCQTTTMTDHSWGVISATLTLADGTGTPAARSHAIRPRFGSGVTPKVGNSMALLSTGSAAGVGDSNPAYASFQDGPSSNGTSSGFPADFLAANNGQLPNAPGCPPPNGNTANDPVMLTLTIRVPTNAHSFKLSTNFFSSEFPEYTCSPFNDFFVVLLDSAYQGDHPNPADKNLAFYKGGTQNYPVGVNLAHGNTGLFTQCKNGATGCRGTAGTISTCTGVDELAGTGLDKADPGSCDSTALEGGATGWLVTSGNVKPGEIITLRIAIWDTSDDALDSLAVIDGFQWDLDPVDPGTVIL